VTLVDIKQHVERGIQNLVRKRSSPPQVRIPAATGVPPPAAAAAAASFAAPAASPVGYVNRVRMWTREQVRAFFIHLLVDDDSIARCYHANIDGPKLLTLTALNVEGITMWSVSHR
jgi:hypothetical protein